MKLTSIAGLNIKGSTFEYSLGAATAIVGVNFSGKSAVLEAIRLCLLGYLPEVGKRTSASWELASGREMVVQASFDAGPSLARRFWLEGATVKTDLQVNRQSVRPEDNGFENLPLLHSEHYFSLTDNERVNYVFDHVNLPESATPAAIVAECQRLSFEEAHSEQIQMAKAKLIRDVEEAFEAPGTSVQAGLSEAIDTFKERFSYWNKRAKETQGAVTTLTELKLREQEVTTAARDLDGEIARIDKELEALMTQRGELNEKELDSSRRASRITVITNQLNEMRDDIPEAIEKLLEKIKGAKNTAPGMSDQYVRRLKTSLQESRAQLAGIVASGKELDKKIMALRQRVSSLHALESCPFCHSNSPGWKLNVAKELQSDIDTANAENIDAQDRLIKLEQEIADMTGKLEGAELAIRANERLLVQVDGWNRELSGLEREKASDESRKAALRAELKELESQPTADNLSLLVATLDRDIALKRCEKEDRSNRKHEEVQLQQDLKRAAQAQLEHLDAAAHVTVIKALAKLLNQKRAELVEEVFQTLLKTANKVCGDILRSPLAMHDGTIGRWSKDAKFIPHRVFSGTEKALAYIAIAVALSAQAPLKLVILDEFGRLDEENQVAVISNLAYCVEAGIIDQFIVVGTDIAGGLRDGSEIVEGTNLKVIELS